MDLRPSMSDRARLAISTIGAATKYSSEIPKLKLTAIHRIWAAIKRETLLVLSEDVGTPEEVDAIFKDVLKTGAGPCELMDKVGLDVVLDIEKHYADSRPGLPTEPQTYLQKMIDGGKLGVKNGQGFYSYKKQ